MDPRPVPRRLADATAFERTRRAMALLAAHEPALRRTARRYAPSRADADDAFQSAVEILLTRAPDRPGSGLIAWMQIVTRREALATARARARALGRPPGDRPDRPDPGPTDPDALEAPAAGPQAAAEARERTARAAARLAALKPQERRALALQGAGCSYAEIQAITGWTHTKVNRCLAEGRAALRRARGAAGPISRASPRTS